MEIENSVSKDTLCAMVEAIRYIPPDSSLIHEKNNTLTCLKLAINNGSQEFFVSAYNKGSEFLKKSAVLLIKNKGIVDEFSKIA